MVPYSACFLFMVEFGDLKADIPLLISFLWEAIAMAAIFALIAFLLGLWARWSLLPFDESNFRATARAIPRKWVFGALCLAAAVTLADVVFQWRGKQFADVSTPDAVIGNIGYLTGVFGASAVVGLVTGYVSRRGLAKAIADDEFSRNWGSVNFVEAPSRRIMIGCRRAPPKLV